MQQVTANWNCPGSWVKFTIIPLDYWSLESLNYTTVIVKSKEHVNAGIYLVHYNLFSPHGFNNPLITFKVHLDFVFDLGGGRVSVVILKAQLIRVFIWKQENERIIMMKLNFWISSFHHSVYYNNFRIVDILQTSVFFNIFLQNPSRRLNLRERKKFLLW